MNLDQEHKKALHAAICDAFTEGELFVVVRLHLGAVSRQFVSSGPLEQVALSFTWTTKGFRSETSIAKTTPLSTA